jgi:hypothetical protein
MKDQKENLPTLFILQEKYQLIFFRMYLKSKAILKEILKAKIRMLTTT